LTPEEPSFWVTYGQPIIITIVGTVLAGIILSTLALLFKATAPYGRRVLGFIWWLISFPVHLRVTTDRIARARLVTARAEGRASLQAEVDAARSVMLLKPRWAISRDPDPNETLSFVLANFAVGAVANDVSLDANSSHFNFGDAAYWEDLTGKKAGRFLGYRTQDGEDVGVTFQISWTDANGDRQVEELTPDPKLLRRRPKA
jgi:hypothetical protein